MNKTSMTYYVELKRVAFHNYTETRVIYDKWTLGDSDFGVMIGREGLYSYFNGEILKLGIL